MLATIGNLCLSATNKGLSKTAVPAAFVKAPEGAEVNSQGRKPLDNRKDKLEPRRGDTNLRKGVALPGLGFKTMSPGAYALAY